MPKPPKGRPQEFTRTTEETKRLYLRALRKLGGVQAAADHIGISHEGIRRLRAEDSTFARDEVLVRDDLEVAAVVEGRLPRSKPSAASTDELVKAYQAGATTKEIGKRFDIRPNTVHRRLTRAGVKMRRRGPRPKWSKQ